VGEVEREGFEIDAATQGAWDMLHFPKPSLTMADLAAVLDQPELLPPGVEASRHSEVEFVWRSTGMAEPLRITTDAGYCEEHPQSVEFWSPGNPLIPAS
jgi:hypothetical protein